MKFLIDNQLPITLATFLRGKGVECKHVLEIALDRASDQEIWKLAESSPSQSLPGKHSKHKSKKAG